jgi:hypothetical protein
MIPEKFENRSPMCLFFKKRIYTPAPLRRIPSARERERDRQRERQGDTNTHTHTHTKREKERQRAINIYTVWWI